jgi:hypothetical protein
MIAVPGLYTISAEEYHADPCPQPSLSSSIIKVLCSGSPWHAWAAHPRLNPEFVREQKEIFDLGTVAHALMLQGIEHACVLKFDDWKKAEARHARDEARASGLIPILQKHWDRVQAMVEAGKRQIAAHKEASEAFVVGSGVPEATLVWTDDHGVHCKARLDWLRHDRQRIFDYKATGATADPEKLSKYATSQGWDIQAAFYLRGLKALGSDADFLFVAQEDYPPYALAVLGLTDETLIVGAKKVQYGIDLFAKCLSSNEWPGYPRHVSAVPFDMWDAERWAAKELR